MLALWLPFASRKWYLRINSHARHHCNLCAFLCDSSTSCSTSSSFASSSLPSTIFASSNYHKPSVFDAIHRAQFRIIKSWKYIVRILTCHVFITHRFITYWSHSAFACQLNLNAFFPFPPFTRYLGKTALYSKHFRCIRNALL